jgi:hypothetical protein
MSEQPPPGAGGAGRQPTEEELRAAYEAELKRLRVDDVVIQTIVSLVNLGGRRLGLAPGTEGPATESERDLDQVRLAIESVRLLLPLVEGQLGDDVRTLREALSQLQMAYVQLSGAAAPGAEAGAGSGAAAGAGQPGGAPTPPGGSQPGPGEPAPGAEPEPAPDEERGPGPAQRSGRLWVPGQ